MRSLNLFSGWVRPRTDFEWGDAPSGVPLPSSNPTRVSLELSVQVLFQPTTCLRGPLCASRSTRMNAREIEREKFAQVGKLVRRASRKRGVCGCGFRRLASVQHAGLRRNTFLCENWIPLWAGFPRCTPDCNRPISIREHEYSRALQGV